MRTAIPGFLISGALIAAPFLAWADTASDLSTLIASLSAQVTALQQQISARSSASAPAASQPSADVPACAFARTLVRGLRGEDVVCLQRTLIAKGYLAADNATGFFGPLTEAAVRRFQKSAGIVSSGDARTTGYGSFGARTYAAMFTYGPAGASSTGTGIQFLPVSAVGCSFNGLVVANGTSLTAYQSATVPYGSQCISEVRMCTGGVLSGSATFPSCAVATPLSCSFASSTVSHGASVVAYGSSSVPAGSRCVAEARTCINGALSGSYPYASCDISYASCTLGGVTVPHGQSRTFYASSTVAYGALCEDVSNVQVRTCQNGTMFGTDTFNKASCTPSATPAACAFAGRTIPHASSTLAYDATCNTQTRTCNNGVLSGSYASTSCPLRSCTLDGVTLLHGQSRVFYNTAYELFYRSCQSVTRTCTDGTLSDGSTAWGIADKASCP